MNAMKTAKAKTEAPSAVLAPKAAVAAGRPRGQYDDILALQRAAGNRAVTGFLQSSEGASRTASHELPPAVQRTLDVNEGWPLDLRTKAEMEARFGQNLNDVRVHTDPIAADSARAIGARAYTVGRHVVFAPAHYAPQTIAGRALLAHELVHVLQQRGGRAAASTAATRNLRAQWEAEADQAGHYISNSHPALYTNGPSPLGPIAFNLKPALASDLAISDPGDRFEEEALHAEHEVATTPRSRAARPLAQATQGGVVTVQRASAARQAKSPVTAEDEQAMRGDVERIVALLKQQILDADEEWQIINMLRKWRDLDVAVGQGETPYLDKILLFAKMRGYTRHTVRSAWVERWAPLYDDLWYEMEDERLEAFKVIVAQSKRQGTTGPGSAQPENIWRMLGKQEAVGLFGMLKGMGVGIATMADDVKWATVKAMNAAGIDVKDPGSAADWLAEQYDISGETLLGKEYTGGEELFWGMTAKDIGTAGGEVIWQLVMLGKGQGGNITKLLDLIGSLHAVESSAQKIADRLNALNADGKVTLAEIGADRELQAAVLELAAAVFGALASAKGGNTKMTQAAKLAAQRVQVLLDVAQTLPVLGKLVDIWNSDLPPDAKRRDVAPVLKELLQKLIQVAMSGKGLAEVSEKGPPGAPATGTQQKFGKQEHAPKRVEAAPARKPATKPKARPAPSGLEAAPTAEPSAKPRGGPTPKKTTTPIERTAVKPATVPGAGAAGVPIDVQLAMQAAIMFKPPQAEATATPAGTAKAPTDITRKTEAPAAPIKREPAKVPEATEVTAVEKPVETPKTSDSGETTDIAKKAQPTPGPEQIATDIEQTLRDLEASEPTKQPAVKAEPKVEPTREPKPEATPRLEPKKPKVASDYRYKNFKEVPLEIIPDAVKAKYAEDYKAYTARKKKEGRRAFSFEDYARFRFGRENELFPPYTGAFQVAQAAGRVAEHVHIAQSGTPKNKRKFETNFGNVIPDFMPSVDEGGKQVSATRPEDALFVADTKILSEQVYTKTGEEARTEAGLPMRKARAIGLTDQICGLVELADKSQSKTLVFIGQKGAYASTELINWAKKNYGVDVRVNVLVDAAGKPIRG